MDKEKALKELGEAVRKLRTEKKLSQHELSAMCSVNKNYIGMVERGEVNPTYLVLCSIAQALKIPTSKLFT